MPDLSTFSIEKVSIVWYFSEENVNGAIVSAFVLQHACQETHWNNLLRMWRQALADAKKEGEEEEEVHAI